MTIRLLSDARGKHRKAFLDRTVALSGGTIDLRVHLGDRDADFHAPSLSRLETRRGRQGHLMAGQRQTGANLALIASENFGQMLETAVDQFHRTSPTYHYRGHNLRNIQDYLDYFHILSDVMAQKIVDEGITHALFYTIPHLAYDTILYEVARSMGVKTIILSQTLTDTSFFSMANVSDYGRFRPELSDAAPFRFERGTVADLYYMKDDWQKPGQTGRLNARAVGYLITYLARHEPLKLFNPGYIVHNLRRMAAIYATLPDWRDPFGKFFHTNELAYFEHLAEYEGTEVDLSRRYIYAPLHNQPEMSTSALGGRWRDQLLMIETLARNLPDGWEIYVKENPRQGAYARGPMFFHRLSRIPSVRFMPSNANTQALSANAQFVATVTGTAGWEAIRKGRPALVFGEALYQSLPGVVKYREGLDFETIAASTFDHAALEQATGALYAQAHPGIIEETYFSKVAGFDFDRNLETVARTTLDILRGDLPLSFSSGDGAGGGGRPGRT